MHFLISAAAVATAAYVLPGVEIQGPGTALAVAALLAVVTVLVGPAIFAATLPVNLVTMGLFTFVILGICVKLVDAMLPGFYVRGFAAAIPFAALVALADGLLEGVYRRLAPR